MPTDDLLTVQPPAPAAISSPSPPPPPTRASHSKISPSSSTASTHSATSSHPPSTPPPSSRPTSPTSPPPSSPPSSATPLDSALLQSTHVLLPPESAKAADLAELPEAPHQSNLASSELAAILRHAVSNASALLQFAHVLLPPESAKAADLTELPEAAHCEIVEPDAVELLADHVHFCEVCGKGFKRDANLRMHMRAHGEKFKSPAALAKPDTGKNFAAGDGIRLSCPFPGCNRNLGHKKFRPLKSAVCVKNHFKRSHCPKMYACNRCNKKSFSVVADLKSHLKHCGECRWKCSCGTSFSRKDKLFGHLALFEGHMPALMGELEKEKMKRVEVEVGEEGDDVCNDEDESSDFGSLNALLDGFNTMDDWSFDGLMDLQGEAFKSNDLG